MKPLESLESTQVKLQGDRPSPKNPRGSQSNLRIPRRELRKLRVAQYVLKIAHLGILMAHEVRFMPDLYAIQRN